jgi:CRP/FNR family cyclic AMP-dependent transcriptional regulator
MGLTEAFSSWPAPLLDRLLPMSRLGRHSRGALVHSETQAEPEILTVVSGHLMVSRVNVDGSRASISVLGPGLVIGIPRGMNPDDEALYDYRANDEAVRSSMCLRASSSRRSTPKPFSGNPWRTCS